MVEHGTRRAFGAVGFRFVAVAIVFLMIAAGSSSASSADQSRVRSTNGEILALLHEGRERSRTFRSLVDEISRSNGIVYIEFGICTFGHLDGCLLPFLVSSQGDRYLRVVVTRGKKRTHDQLLALIAHEMRHALEVLEHEEVVDVQTLESMYRKIGLPHEGGSHGYETSAARAAGGAVFDELLLGRRR